MLAAGGIVTMISSYPVSFEFPKYQPAILAAISCLFDASSLVFTIFLQLKEKFGISRRDMFLGYCGVPLLLHSFFLYAYTRVHSKESSDSTDVENSVPVMTAVPVEGTNGAS